MTKKSALYAVCVIVVMGIIFGFSSQSQKETIKTSNIIVKPIENVVKNDGYVFESEKEEKEYLKKLESKLDKLVRKSAHMIIFGVLSVFVYLLCKSFGMNDADAIIVTLAVCGIYGCTDELHQKFVKGRTSQFIDVCVDEMGCVIVLIFIHLMKKMKTDVKIES